MAYGTIYPKKMLDGTFILLYPLCSIESSFNINHRFNSLTSIFAILSIAFVTYIVGYALAFLQILVPLSFATAFAVITACPKADAADPHAG
jgi:hypothetical protein